MIFGTSWDAVYPCDAIEARADERGGANATSSSRDSAQLVLSSGRDSNGSVKEMNAKAKLATKMAYGFNSHEKAKTAPYHQLGKLPEPIRTHRFC